MYALEFRAWGMCVLENVYTYICMCVYIYTHLFIHVELEVGR